MSEDKIIDTGVADPFKVIEREGVREGWGGVYF